jgi:hypothetical protein
VLFYARYAAGEVLVIDDLLTPDALQQLRTIALRAPQWEVKAGGYLGAFMEKGFAPAAVARLATELEAAMPRIFGRAALRIKRAPRARRRPDCSRSLRAGHTLSMFWGFKHNATGGTLIKAHADPAAINLNLWIAPDDDVYTGQHARGGLIVYNKSSARKGMEDHRLVNKCLTRSFRTRAPSIRACCCCCRCWLLAQHLPHMGRAERL